MSTSITLRICSFCAHDLGLTFTCPQCNTFQELPFSYTIENRIICENCDTGEVPSPFTISCTTPEVEGNDHICQRQIKVGTSIQEIHPLTQEVENSYFLGEERNLYPNNVVDTYYLEGTLRVCRFCRYIPSNTGSQYPEVFLAMLCEEDMESVIREYYDLFPTLKLTLPPDTRRGITAEEWSGRIRELAVQEISRNLQRYSFLPLERRKMAVTAESKLYYEIICRDTFPSDNE